MKTVTSTNSWIFRSQHRDSAVSSEPPLTPTFITPRPAPKPPGFPPLDSPSISTIKPVIRTRAPSLHSAYSSTTTTTSSDSLNSHPYSAVRMAPLPVVSSHSPPHDGNECPVCLEPLSFSFKLPGEKPHIVPECGHSLHEVCCSPLYPSSCLFKFSTARLASPQFMGHPQAGPRPKNTI